MIAKKHQTSNGLLLAICDEDILGKKFEEGKLQLDLSSSFYKGDNVSEEHVSEMLKAARIINLSGKKSVSLAIKLGIVDEDNVIWIAGMPHAQAVRE